MPAMSYSMRFKNTSLSSNPGFVTLNSRDPGRFIVFEYECVKASSIQINCKIVKIHSFSSVSLVVPYIDDIDEVSQKH